MVIVTELLPGMSLRKFLISIRPRKLDLRVALNFAFDIARAMECLHANGIIHRDLKPGTSRICKRNSYFHGLHHFRIQTSYFQF